MSMYPAPLDRTGRTLARGDRVRIIAGNFTGQVCTVVSRFDTPAPQCWHGIADA